MRLLERSIHSTEERISQNNIILVYEIWLDIYHDSSFPPEEGIACRLVYLNLDTVSRGNANLEWEFWRLMFVMLALVSLLGESIRFNWMSTTTVASLPKKESYSIGLPQTRHGEQRQR
eukprot:scaffold5322_cov127-Alexandrium_tamarense.AAC.1